MQIAEGNYKTRNGKIVTVHSIKELNDKNEKVTFPVKGSIWKSNDKIGNNPKYGIWTDIGNYLIVGESSLDLIEKIN